MSRVRFAFVVVVVAVLCACGSRGSGVLPQPVGGVSAIGASLSASAAAAQTVAFRLRIPWNVSPAAHSVKVVVTQRGSSAGTFVSSCHYPGCAVKLRAPAGLDAFAVTLYGGQRGAGAVLAQGTATAKIVAGRTNAVKVVANGIPASIAIGLMPNSVTSGFPTSVSVSAAALDASGYTIIGKYRDPLTLGDSDTSGATRLSTTLVAASSTTVALKYSGAAFAGATISATAAGVPPQNVTPATLAASSGQPSSLPVLWTPIGPREPPPGMTHWWNPGSSGNSGKLNAVVIDPSNPQTMYVAGGVGRDCEVVSAAGIFKSVDGGASWAPIDQGLGDTTVDDLWIDPANPQNLVAATEKAGLYFSGNGGAYWTSSYPAVTGRMLVQSGAALYAATSAGVLRSGNDGASWQIVLPTPDLVNALGAANGAIYAGTVGGTTYESYRGVWRQGGSVPTQCGGSSGLRDFAVDPRNPTVAFAANNAVIGGSVGGSLWKTTDFGQTWQSVALPSWLTSGQGSQTIAFSLVSPGTLYVGGDVTAATYAAGKWTQMLSTNSYKLNNIFGDMRRLYVLPAAGGERIVAASDQGAWSASTFDGAGLTALTAGLSVNVVTDVAVSGNAVVTTMQDFVAMQTRRPGGKWAYGLMPYEDGSVAIGSGANASNCAIANADYYGYSTDGCLSLVRQASKTWSGSQGRLIFDPVNTATMYAIASNGQIYVSADAGKTLAPTGWSVAANRLAIDPENDQNLYAPTADGSALEYTHDGGTSWAKAKLACSDVVVAAVDPLDSKTVVAACEDPSGAKIYRSIDQGATFSYVALAITSNLRVRRNDYQMLYRSLKMRQIPRRFDAATAYYAIPFDLQFNPAPPAGQTPALVLATSTGGAISYDGGATWSTIDGDASSTQFWAVAWSNGRAFVATRGQGVIMAPLQAP